MLEDFVSAIDLSLESFMINAEPLLTIGLPVYNGGAFLRNALDSILGQDFQRFVIFASDNASTDDTFKVLSEYKQLDRRISFVRQNENLGASENFKAVSNNIETPYFMWFAADDEMAPGFLSYCVSALESDRAYGMAFTGIVNIDSRGRVTRKYPRLSYFSGKASLRSISRFVLSPEFFGKANLFYSVYRTSLFREVFSSYGMPTEWGGDMAFVLAALSRSGISISYESLFRKRYVQDGEIDCIPTPVPIPKDFLSINCPLTHLDEYEAAILRAVKGTSYEMLVFFLMRLRRIKLEFFEETFKSRGAAPLGLRRSAAKLIKDLYKISLQTWRYVKANKYDNR